MAGRQGSMFRRVIGAADARSVWVLHGLLGQGRNWQSVSMQLNARTGLSFCLFDLRNHGRSHGFHAPHTIDACVEDLAKCGHEAARSPTALIGHSLGGKVLLQLLRSPDALSRLMQFPVDGSGVYGNDRALQVFIVDSFPGALRHSRRDVGDEVDGVFEVLDFIARAPAVIPSKQWLLDSCKTAGISNAVAQWLLTNLTQLPSHPRQQDSLHAVTAPLGTPDGGFQWVFEPAAAAAMFESHNETDTWDVLVEGPPPGVDVHLIMASRSTRWHDARTRELLAQAARAQAAFIESASVTATGRPARGNVFQYTLDAGHWVHTDNPAALADVIAAPLHGLGSRPPAQ